MIDTIELTPQLVAQEARWLLEDLTANGRRLDDWELHDFGYAIGRLHNNRFGQSPDSWLRLALTALNRAATPRERRSPHYPIGALPDWLNEEWISNELRCFGG